MKRTMTATIEFDVFTQDDELPEDRLERALSADGEYSANGVILSAVWLPPTEPLAYELHYTVLGDKGIKTIEAFTSQEASSIARKWLANHNVPFENMYIQLKEGQ